MKINFVYAGMESDKDLNDLLEFVSNRNLILVILPVIEESKEQITLNNIYEKIKVMGIKEEKSYIDNEGIEKRFIELLSGAKVLLRAEELSDHKPYVFCKECNEKAMCREGIFPLRFSSTGDLIPCLASNNNRVSIRDAIKARNDKEVVSAINMIRNWKVNYE
jgi:molybdenum cofactor biosynthesis enzyme MoaA